MIFNPSYLLRVMRSSNEKYAMIKKIDEEEIVYTYSKTLTCHSLCPLNKLSCKMICDTTNK